MRLNKSIFIAIVAIFLSCHTAFAVYPNGRWFAGKVFMDGAACPDGIVVEGWIGSSNHINATVGSGAPSGEYAMLYPKQDDPPGTAGGQLGDTVVFKIGSLNASQTAVFNDSKAGIVPVNLTFSDTVAPSAPSSLSATEVAAGVINLTWSAASDNIAVQKYLVYRGTSTGVTKDTGTNIGNTTNDYYTDSGLTLDGSTYYYVVTAMDTSNEGDESSEASESVSDTSAPSTPTGLTAVDVSSAEGQLFIRWEANSEADFANYTLYFSSDNTSFTAETQTTALNYTDSGLTDGTPYYYRLRAMDTSGNPSGNATAAGTPVDDVAPNAATGVQVADVASAENKVTVSWTAGGSADTAGYKLYKDDVLVETLAGQSNVSYLDTNVVDGTQYAYKVSAYDEVPNYATNASGSGTPVDDLAPKVVTVQSATSSNNTVTIAWVNVTQNSDNSAIQDLTGFHVYMNSTFSWRIVKTTTALSYTNNTLTNQQTYYFKIAAYDDAGNEGQNSTITSATPSERPTISVAPNSGSVIKSSVLINVSISSGQTIDLVYYRVWNATGQVDPGQTNASVGTTSWSYTINPISWAENVLHTVVVFANDTNSQSTQQNFTYKTDDSVPAVTSPVVNDADSKVKSTQAIVINVTVADSNTITSVTVANESSVDMSVLSGNVYYALTNASALGCQNSDGACVVRFTATDVAGNVNNSEALTLTIDDIPPAVSSAVTSDADDKVRSTDNFQVNVTVIDTNTISSVTVSVSGGNSLAMTNIAGNVYSRSANASALGCSEGTCTFIFTATDEVGNVNSSTTLPITVDDTAPTIHSVSVSDDYVQNNTAVVATVNVSDTNSVASVTAEGTALTQVGASNIWNGSISLAYGNSVVDIVAVDVVGNTQTDNSTGYTIDDTAPSINSVSMSDNYVQNNTNVTVTVNATDAAIYSVTAEGIALSRSGDIWVGTVALLAGASPLNVVATDNASNQATDNSLSYTVDDADPVVNSVTLSDSYVSAGQVVQVTVNVTDGYTYSVTANSVSLTNTSSDIWVGNLTMPSSSGLVTVTATDGAGNTKTDNATGYTVDSVSPVISVAVPLSNVVYTHAAGNITFNFTVADKNITRVNVSVDDRTYTYGSATNGTHLHTFTGLKVGTHTAAFTATDEAGNSAAAVTRSFKIMRPLNVTKAISDIDAKLGTPVQNITILANTTDLSSNESANANTTLTLNMELNVSGTNATAQIPGFNGLEANWENTFGVETDESSLKAVLASSKAGSAIQTILLFENVTDFIADDQVSMVVITFDAVLADLNVLYIEDDYGEVVYKLTYCDTVPTSVASATDACYTNTSTNITMYLPHFSGGSLANDTSAPTINLTSPTNGSTVNNSYFTLGFTVYEANPNSDTFCNYTLYNGSQNVYYDLDIDSSEMTNDGSTAYLHSQLLYNLKDGAYNLTVYCADARDQVRRAQHSITVADTVSPTITGSSPSGAQSTSGSSLTVTLSATTDERSICKYGTSNVSYGNMTIYLGSNSEYGLTHQASLSYSADASSVRYYVVCRDINGLDSASTLVSYSVDVTAATTTTGGGGGAVTPTAAVVRYSQQWSEIEAGAVTVRMDKEGLAFTRVHFTALETLASPEITIAALTEAPSATGELGYTAYQYLTITGTNIAAEKITDTRIEFKVDKSWLESNQVDRENIALYRYTLDEWVEQATRVKSEDTGYVYYEATTLGLSYFAIGERPEKEVVVEETTPIDEGKPEEVVKEKVVAPVVEKAPESVIEEKPSFEWSWLVLVVGIAIVVAGLAFGVYEVVMHRKTQESGASAKKTEAKKTENKKT